MRCSSGENPVADRARAWRHAAHAAVCDVLEPWASRHGRACDPLPAYYDFNVVRVEDDPAMSVEALAAFADEALAGLAHRRVDFDLDRRSRAAASRVRGAGLEGPARCCGCATRHRRRPARTCLSRRCPTTPCTTCGSPGTRRTSPRQDPAGYHAQAREVALRRDAQVLAVREGGAPVAFAQLERDGAASRDHPGLRPPRAPRRRARHGHDPGGDRGAGDVRDLWIAADDDDRPKELYARLGFRPASTTMEFLRLPAPHAHTT